MRFLAGHPFSREALDARLYAAADFNLDTDLRTARFVELHTLPGESIFVWGFEPHVYWFSGRRSASRYLYDVPQRVAWAKEREREVLMRDLEKSRPAAIVVEHRDVFPVVTGDAIDSADTLKDFPALTAMLDSRFEFSSTIEDFDIYLERAR